MAQLGCFQYLSALRNHPVFSFSEPVGLASELLFCRGEEHNEQAKGAKCDGVKPLQSQQE